MTENSAAHNDLPDHIRSDQQSRLGRQSRKLRHRQGLTLVGLAALTNLSHPFLSQVERGLATPSMASLERISTASGSSQSELMARGRGRAGAAQPAARGARERGHRGDGGSKSGC